MAPKHLAFLGTALAVASGTLYLVVYWSSFNINVFEFDAFSDVVVSSIVPLAAIAIIVGLYALLYSPIVFILDKASRENEKTPLDDLTFWRTMIRNRKLWLKAGGGAFAGLAAFGFIGMLPEWYQFVYAFAFLAVIGIANVIRDAPPIVKLIPSLAVRWIFIAFLISVPLFSSAHGLVRAMSVMFGNGDFLYVCETHLKRPERAFGDTELRYIGKAGDFFFFFTPRWRLPVLMESNQVRLLKYEDFRVFALRRANSIQKPSVLQRLIGSILLNQPQSSTSEKATVCTG